jgi:hypothetical protein
LSRLGFPGENQVALLPWQASTGVLPTPEVGRMVSKATHKKQSALKKETA